MPTDRTPPAFPLGIYAAPASLDGLPAIPFDSVAFGTRDPGRLQVALQTCRRLGLQALASPPTGGADAAQRLAHEFPELRWWYVADEPEGHQTPPTDLMRQRLQLGGVTPSLPSAIALLRSWRAGDYAPAVDVIMVDPYPIPFDPIARLARCIEEARALAGPDKAIWAVIQGFAWKDIYTGPDPSISGCAPTEDEIRALAYLALVHRVRGLFFFSQATAMKSGIWDEVVRVAEELKRDIPLFQHAEPLSESPFACEESDGYDGPAVHSAVFVLKESHGKDWPAGRYAVAVNTIASQVAAASRVPLRTRDGDVVTRLEFGPFEVRIIALGGGE